MSGPTPTSHVPGRRRHVSTMKPTASVPSSGGVGCGRSAPSSPLSPCTCVPWRGSSSSGRSAPECTGTSMPSRSRMTRALCVVRSSGALPATVVMPSSSAWRAATTMAMASSCPGSQSRIERARPGLSRRPDDGGSSAPSSRSTRRPTHSPSSSAAITSASVGQAPGPAAVVEQARWRSPAPGSPSRPCMTV